MAIKIVCTCPQASAPPQGVLCVQVPVGAATNKSESDLNRDRDLLVKVTKMGI